MYKRILITGLFVFSVATAAVTLNSATGYADGNGSPVACNSNPNVNPNAANVLGSRQGTDDVVVVDAGAGNVVEGVCIKSGSNMFGGASHSGVLGNGTYENGCYKVEGVGTQIATVTRLLDGPNCQGISHIDVIIKKPTQPVDTLLLNGGRGGGETTAPTAPVATPQRAPQVSAPAASVNAGGGAIMAAAAALIGSLASIGYGVSRLSKSNL